MQSDENFVDKFVLGRNSLETLTSTIQNSLHQFVVFVPFINFLCTHCSIRFTQISSEETNDTNSIQLRSQTPQLKLTTMSTIKPPKAKYQRGSNFCKLSSQDSFGCLPNM